MATLTKEEQRFKLLSPEVIYQMGKIAKKHKIAGHIETAEEREERRQVLTYCLGLISLYSQAAMLDLEKVKVWLEKAYKENPEKTVWHVVRAGGFGGSDMGVLYAATEGDNGQSPFNTPRDIVASKTFQMPVGDDNIHTARGTRMEAFIKETFLAGLADGSIVDSELSHEEQNRLKNSPEENPIFGAKSILTPEMEADFVSFFDPEYPWLNGNPDEIIMKANGDIVIVDYKAPVDAHGQVPDYYYAQLHHYGVIFKKLYPEMADKVNTVALAPFNYREGAKVEYIERPYSKEVEEKVLRVGDKYWYDYVMKNRLPKSIELGATTEVEDLKIRAVERDETGLIVNVHEIDFTKDIEEGLVSPDMKKYFDPETGTTLSIDGVTDSLNKMMADYASIRHISREGEKESEEISFTIKHLVMGKLAFDEETDIIRTPVASIYLVKRYDIAKLLPDLQKYWEKLNLSPEMLNTEIYNNPRAYITNNFSQENFYQTTKDYLFEVAWERSYNKGEIEKTPENEAKAKEISEKLDSELKLRKGAVQVDLLKISEFIDAIDTTNREFDINYLIEFTKRVDPVGGFPFREYIDINASDVSVKLRQPRDEYDLEVVEKFRDEAAKITTDFAEKVGLSYLEDRRAATKQDVIVAEENKKQEQLEKEAAKEAARADRERLAAEKKAADEEAKAQRKAEEKAKKALENVDDLSDKAKSNIQNAADDLLGGAKKTRKRIIKS